MNINTDHLRTAIENAEEKLLQDRYNSSWAECPISFLNASESRQIKRIQLVEDIENLTAQLLAYGVWPSK